MKTFNYKKYALLTCLSTSLAMGVYAQEKAITINLTDENGVAIPYADVTIIPPSNDTIFTMMGHNMPLDWQTIGNQKAKVIISFDGYKSKVLEQQDYTSLSKLGTIVLQSDISLVDETVVVGYGTNSKKKITSAISQVKSEDLNKYASANVGQMLQGKASGVLVNEPSGAPGSAPRIEIRGVGTLTAGVNPLIVVDGLPLSEGTTLNSINPNDIETLDILKDPASASIYGSRAANGVILITTKQADSDKPKITFDAYTGMQMRADKMELIDAYDAAVFLTEARDEAYVRKNPGVRKYSDDQATRIANGASKRDLRFDYIDPYLKGTPGLTNTNWLNEIFRTAPINNYNLSIAGKVGNKSNYYIGGGYMNQKGIVYGSDYERFSATLKIETKVSDKLKLGASILPSLSNANYDNEIYTAVRAYPFFNVYNADGSLSISEQIKANTAQDGPLDENAIARTDLIKKYKTDFRTIANSFVEYQLLPGLKWRSTLGGDFFNEIDDYYDPSNVGAYRTAAPKVATASEAHTNYYNVITEHTLNYNKQLARHSFGAMAGYSFQKENGYYSKITGTSIPDDNLDNIAGASSYAVSTSRYTWAQVSYFGRLQYDYANKYLLTASFRRDGSSRFGMDSKWGNFPSLTAGWIVSNEDFMKGTEHWLSFMKLRASWGMAGNNQIGSYGSQALLSANNYVYNNVAAAGYYASTAPNPGLSWETQISTNIGADFVFFKKWNVGFNYYNANTRDLLLNVPVPEQSGYSESLQNIGKVRNRGFELDLGASNINLGRVKWSWNANFSHNKNTVLALADGQDQIISGNFITKVGSPIAQFYGYNITGIYKSQEEIDNSPHMTGTQLGDNIIEDTNGDGEITIEDKIGFGTYAPKFSYGFTTNFSYKGFDLSIALNGVEGRTIYDGGLANHESGEAFVIASQYYFDNRYHPVNNPDGFLPQATTNFSQNRLQTAWGSSSMFFDADFLRIRNVQLGYTFNFKKDNRLNIAGARVYLSANNLHTFTKFRGFNPEGTSTNILQAGSASNNYPVPRSFIVGVKLTF